MITTLLSSASTAIDSFFGTYITDLSPIAFTTTAD